MLDTLNLSVRNQSLNRRADSLLAPLHPRHPSTSTDLLGQRWHAPGIARLDQHAPHRFTTTRDLAVVSRLGSALRPLLGRVFPETMDARSKRVRKGPSFPVAEDRALGGHEITQPLDHLAQALPPLDRKLGRLFGLDQFGLVPPQGLEFGGVVHRSVSVAVSYTGSATCRVCLDKQQISADCHRLRV